MLLSRRFSAAAMLALAALTLCATISSNAVLALPSPGRGRKEGQTMRTRGRRRLGNGKGSPDSKDDSSIIGSSFTTGREGDAFGTGSENVIAVVENTDFINAPEPTSSPVAPITVVTQGSVSVNFAPTKPPKSTKRPTPAQVPVPTAPRPAPAGFPVEPGRSGPSSSGTSSSNYDVSSNNNGELVVNGNVIGGVGANTNTNGNSGNSAFNSQNNNNGWVAVENTNAQTSGAQTSVSTETSNLATTYEDKCAAAEAGQEFRTRSTVPVYYEYELVTSSTRNVLQVVDTVDKAIQHFLAVWLVDCDNGNIMDAAADTPTSSTINNGQRSLMEQSKMHSQLSRHLQEYLAPIVGTGVGDYDTVILDGSEAAACETLMASEILGQACYKVVGSTVIFINEEIKVTPTDIQTLAMETLNIGLNYAGTDFTQLDPDIFGLFLVQGYDEAPESVISDNFEANKRPWATTEQKKPFNNASKEEGRSGGAKFGIAFATLFFITLFVLLCVYLYKNRVEVFGDVDWENCCCCLCFGCGSDQQLKPKNQNRHANLDDITVPSTKYEPSRGQDDGGFQRSEDPSFRDFNNESPESVKTRPLSPEPESPREYSPAQVAVRDQEEAPSFVDESNIYTPRSDHSGGSRSVTNSDTSEMFHSASSPGDRIHLNLSQQAIRGSHRKSSQKTSPTSRTYGIQDTVEL